MTSPKTFQNKEKGVKAWAVGYDAVAHHADLLVERLAKVLSELKSL